MKEKIGRNDPCPCGSGKKFKKCCEGRMIGKRFMAHKIDSPESLAANKISGLTSLFQANVQNPKDHKSDKKIEVSDKEKEEHLKEEKNPSEDVLKEEPKQEDSSEKTDEEEK